MNPILLAQLLSSVLSVAPQAIGLVIKIKEDIESAKTATTVTTADLTELMRLAANTSASIYAKAGITPPPAT